MRTITILFAAASLTVGLFAAHAFAQAAKSKVLQLQDLRASVQALLSFVNGSGQLAGHLLVGWLRRAEVWGVYPNEVIR